MAAINYYNNWELSQRRPALKGSDFDFLQILLNLNSYELTLIYQCTLFYSRVYSILILIKSSADASIKVVVV